MGHPLPRLSAGDHVGRFTLTKRVAASDSKSGRAEWICRCDCGTSLVVQETRIVSGNTRSCGCMHREQLGARKLRHGGTETREYKSWQNMKSRCTNPRLATFKNYGGRGITVDPAWNDFAAFIRDMGPCPEGWTLERIDNERGYSADNCKWATRLEQTHNRRTGSQRGAKNPKAKLTEADVREIRALKAQGAKTADLMRRFHVSQHAILAAVNRETWSHLY